MEVPAILDDGDDDDDDGDDELLGISFSWPLGSWE